MDIFANKFDKIDTKWTKISYYYSMKRVLNIITNKYFLVLGLAALWIVFFDNYNILAQMRVKSQIEQLAADKVHYQEKIEALDFEREKLFSNSEEMERYAREKYFMRKAGEDIFVVVEE